jgi:transposase
MVAIGIDVSKGRSTIVALGEGKRVLQKPFDIAHTKTGLAQLATFVEKFGSDTRVVMEHTGVCYLTVAETLRKAGGRVSAVNPVLIKQFGDNTLRKVSTDNIASMKIAQYTPENRDQLRDYTVCDPLRDSLKSLVRQFEFEDKTLTAHKNSLNALLERTFPGIDGYFSSPTKATGHQKLIDFVLEFRHSDCVSGLSEAKFSEKYARFCKKNRYCFNEAEAKQIHAMSRENLTAIAKNDTGKTLVTGVAGQVLQLSVRSRHCAHR